MKITDETVTGLFGEMDYNHQQKLWDSSVNALGVKAQTAVKCCKWSAAVF